MRSNFVRAAFAALLLSSSFGFAAQAAPGDAFGGGQTTRTDQIEETPQAAPPAVSHAMAVPAAATAHPVRPRLRQIEAQLNRIDHRIRVDSRHGYLTAAERAAVRHEAGQIRREAMATASRHNGAIPHARFMAYQQDLRDLGHRIHRLSTNRATA